VITPHLLIHLCHVAMTPMVSHLPERCCLEFDNFTTRAQPRLTRGRNDARTRATIYDWRGTDCMVFARCREELQLHIF
jgi:hypothetical protein